MPEPVDLNFVASDVWGGSVLQWADRFTSIKDLVDQAIAKLKPGRCIRRLVIAAHGAENTDGFTVFDPETRGVEWIDGAQKQPLSADVTSELQRLRAHFCKDAVIEFRICRMGAGKKGEKAMQAVADVTGVAVTGPVDEISSLAAVGGLTVSWTVAYPKSWGLVTSTGFFRGGPYRPPLGARAAADIAPVTGQVVPLREVTTPPPTTDVPMIRKVTVVNPRPKNPNAAMVGAAGVLIGAVLLGWIFFGGGAPGSPISAAPTATPPATATPRATPPSTASPTAEPTATPTLAPTATPTPAPAATPAVAPTPTLFTAIVVPDGRYTGDGTFTSFDGSESYATAWRLTKKGEGVEIAQLLRPGGRPFQTASGIADPHGVMVAVIDDPTFCEVLLLPVDKGQPASFLFVAYGPPSMTCPAPEDFAQVFGQLIDDPNVLDVALPSHYGWGEDVTVGLANIQNWMMRR